MCIAFWLRSGPNDYVLWIMSWNSHDGLPFHTHIGTYKTYIQSNKVRQDHVILDEKWKRKRKIRYELSHIPSTTKVIFDCWFFGLFLRGQVFVFVPLKWGLHILSFTFQNLWYSSMGNICNFQLPPCFGPHAKIHFSTQVDISEKWPCRALELNGLRHWSSPHDVILKFIACARIIVTLFHVSNVFQVIIY
jgi:hypothetical protein